jgi:hypothetical protein
MLRAAFFGNGNSVAKVLSLSACALRTAGTAAAATAPAAPVHARHPSSSSLFLHHHRAFAIKRKNKVPKLGAY